MASKNSKNSSLAVGMILLAVGSICIGYDLAKIVNDLDGAGLLAAMGGMCAALSAVLMSRSANSSD